MKEAKGKNPSFELLRVRLKGALIEQKKTLRRNTSMARAWALELCASCREPSSWIGQVLCYRLDCAVWLDQV